MTHRLLLLVLLSLSSLPGCLGLVVGTFGTSEGEVSNPTPSSRWDGRRAIPRWGDAEPEPSAKLLDEWGQPDSQRILPHGTEEWTYDAGLRCVGGFACLVILPVPLGIPVGREHVTFVIDDQRIVSGRSKVTDFGSLCGVVWAPSWFRGGGWFAECGGGVEDRFANPFR